MNVEIQGRTYRFQILDDSMKSEKDSFNQLAKETFGISFEHVGGFYLPYVLLDGDCVVANISVNHMHMKLRGEKRFYIQLGTVMTRQEYRNLGLSRWLMERILEEWKDQCDGMYLFANDKVLEFYPRFGFIKKEEYQAEITVWNEEGSIRQLDMKKEEDRELLLQCYEQGNPYSQLSSENNTGVLMFYCGSIMSEHIYYLEEEGLVAVVEYDSEYMECCDIFGESKLPLEQVLGVLAQEEEQKVVLGFSPVHQEGFTLVLHREEDTTLFVLEGGEDLFGGGKLMFPILSHT